MEIEKSKIWKKAGDRKPLAIVFCTIAVVMMLTIGIGVAQYQTANVAVKKMTATSQEPCSECGETSYTGDESVYCPIVTTGAPYIAEMIESGDLDFTELQAAVESMKTSEVTRVAQIRGISFSIVPIPSPELPGEITSIDVTKDSYDVKQRLTDRLLEAQGYCQTPVQEPTDWHMHPQALCLSIGLTPILGLAMANGVVVSFFALFGIITLSLGEGWFILLLRGLGILDVQILQACASIYRACMGILGSICGNGICEPGEAAMGCPDCDGGGGIQG
ncbi:MAG: hypothetical protein NT038_08435 [Euryarchaeota archaeon]|nr:hypothetical protein [Euryarchaeota archaeon]